MPPFNIFDWANHELGAWILQNGEAIQFQCGDALIQEGECCLQPMVLLEGSLQVSTTNWQQEQERVTALGEGSIVGEMSWLEARPAVATITASSACKVLRLPVQQISLLSQEQPEMVVQLFRLIAQKLAVQVQGQNAWVHRLQVGHGSSEALRKVLTLFATLQEKDLVKLARLGQVHRLAPQSVLLQQGDEVSALYLVLSGEAEILLTSAGATQVVGTSRRGELLGEMSLLLGNEHRASAGVRTEKGMDLLKIRLSTLLDALDEDSGLANRFYFGVACMLSQRSRDQLLSHQRAAASYQAEKEASNRLDVDQLVQITRAARHFDWLCRYLQTRETAML